jgi:hypothetical protein
VELPARSQERPKGAAMRNTAATTVGSKSSRGRRSLRPRRWTERATSVRRPVFRDGKVRGARKSGSPRHDLQQAGSGVVCRFGTTCVGVLLERVQLHLMTQRFLAARRGDRVWEASCDYAALSLEKLGMRLRPGMFEQPLFPNRSGGESPEFRVRHGRASLRSSAGGSR